MEKTNAMRILDQKKIKYDVFEYDSEITNGTQICEALNENPDNVYKTLVTVGKSGKNYVFDIPVNKELDLKKAAKLVGEKSIEMLKSKDLLPLTGYIHGGCSPIGMKKQFPTAFNESINNQEDIYFSAGKRGLQVKVKSKDLFSILNIKICDIIKED